MNAAAWPDLASLWADHLLVRLGAVAVAAVLASLILEGIYRFGFQRLAARTRSGVDDRIFASLHRVVRLSVALVAFTVAARILGPSAPVVAAVDRIAISIGLIAWTGAVLSALSLLLREGAGSGRFSALQPRTLPLFDVVQKVALSAAAIYVFFLVWSIDVTAWVASAGIVGIAVGFAAKDTLANLFSGVFILVDAPYRIGDMIVLDSGERGRVTDVGIRSTRIVTRDDVEITIPNSQIGAAKIMNESGGPYRKRRLDIRVGVSYSSDVDLVKRLLGEVAQEVELVCDDPAPRVRFREMADSALVFSLLFWVMDPEQRGLATDQANTLILRKFRAAGVEIPFPQRVVHLVPPAGVGT